MLTEVQIAQRVITNKKLNNLLVTPPKHRATYRYDATIQRRIYNEGMEKLDRSNMLGSEILTEYDHYCFGRNSTARDY